MRIREFYNRVNNSSEDIIQKFIDILEGNKIPYAVIGGFAVNAYSEPVITQDFDCIIKEDKLRLLRELLKKEGFKVDTHPYTIEVTSLKSEIKIHIQRNKGLQSFLNSSEIKEVMGYKLQVASKEAVLKSKIQAYGEQSRKAAKRMKDLLDIKRMTEDYPELINLLPPEVYADIQKFEK